MLLHLPLEITGKSNENLRSNGQRPLLYSQIFGSSGSMKWKRSNVGDCRSQNWLLQCFSFALVFLWALVFLLQSSHVRIGSEASKTNKKMSINPNLYQEATIYRVWQLIELTSFLDEITHHFRDGFDCDVSMSFTSTTKRFWAGHSRNWFILKHSRNYNIQDHHN